MTIVDFLDALDKKVFLFLNGLHSPFFDQVMWQVSGKYLWVPFYLAILVFMGWHRKWNMVITVLVIALMILVSDQFSVLVKDTVMRLRPCHSPDIMGMVHTVNGKCGGQFGFVSSHAANTFAVAAFVSLFFSLKWVSWIMYSWAALVSYSRIYLGVHYTGDVLGGILVGLVVGTLLHFIEIFIQQRVHRLRKPS